MVKGASGEIQRIEGGGIRLVAFVHGLAMSCSSFSNKWLQAILNFNDAALSLWFSFGNESIIWFSATTLCAGLAGELVDVRRAIPHHPAAVDAEVREADVVTPDDDDVGFVSVCPSLSSDVVVTYPMQGGQCKNHRSNMRSFQHRENSSTVSESKNTKC